MVTDPGEYLWSSYGAKAIKRKAVVIDFHPCYLALGENDGARQKVYAEYVYTDYVYGTVPENELISFKERRLQRGQLSGSDRFRAEMERKHGIRLSNKRQGRPRKVDE